MNSTVINGLDLIAMIENGAKNLALDYERINALNVFPVPDGDTGTNMKLTIEGGALEGKSIKEENIEIAAKAIARAMVLSARGNSGVILSQFFKGISLGLEGYSYVNVKEFANAMIEGTKRAYSVVSNPTEGTILTVMREAGEAAIQELSDDTTLDSYLVSYLHEANMSLQRTPELLPVLKKAGVIDSGGAGFILIIEGMLKAINGEILADAYIADTKTNVNTSGFNADSELTYGYCTEFILQLQNSKVNTKEFDIKVINDFLNTIGNSIVSFKDDDLVKVHVHTFDPGIVLNECRKYGEFLTVKIENMNVMHTDASDYTNEGNKEEVKEHKKYAVVAVANGVGLVNAFKDMGVDEVVSGGQTMNTSTADFIAAFDKINADNILVFPNNSNILMAANQAKDSYTKANIYVIPTKTLAQGYSGVSMLNFDSDDIDTIIAEAKEAIANVSTLEVTYSIRDAHIDDIDVCKGDYICIYNGKLIASDKNRLEAVKLALRAIDDFDSKQVMTILCGRDVLIEECNELQGFAMELNSYIEAYPVDGNQDIYSYIIGIE